MAENYPTDIASLLSKYPKTRPPLPDEYKKIHDRAYKASRKGATFVHRLVLRVEGWMHWVIGARSQSAGRVLEIGAGTLNHLPFEKCVGHYDVVEPYRDLYIDSLFRSRVTKFYDDMKDVPPDERYDRILSIATFEHLEDLPGIICRAGMLLAEGGVLQVAIPSEGAILWRLASTLVTGTVFRLQFGLSYSTFMRHEHINQAGEIEDLIRYFFEDVTIRRFPTPYFNLSVYSYLEARGPRRSECLRYLNR